MKHKILFLLHLPPPVHGSSMVGQFIKESNLINNNFSCRYINLLASKTIHETGKLNFKKILGFVQVWFQLLVELITKKPQLCYVALTTTGAAFYKDVLLIVLLKLFNVKRVYHLHNKGVRNFQKHIINKWLYQFVFRNAEVILLSKYLYEDINMFVPKTKIHICPNGIEDVASFSKEKQIIKRPVQLLFLSNLIESKGVLVLLEACKLLKDKNIDFYCQFIGGEGDISADQLNDKIKTLGLDTNVSYLGKKYGVEKNNYFQQADIFAFPTYYSNECFPLVLLEGMCFSLPIVSTFEGGIPDVVLDGETGFLVPQKNVLALAEKLELLIQNSELRIKMGCAGRKKYEQEFTLTKFENNLATILEKIISHKV